MKTITAIKLYGVVTSRSAAVPQSSTDQRYLTIRAKVSIGSPCYVAHPPRRRCSFTIVHATTSERSDRHPAISRSPCPEQSPAMRRR
jgi:hypothetical protein